MNKFAKYGAGLGLIIVALAVVIYCPDSSDAQEALSSKSIAGIKFSYPIEATVEKGSVRFVADKPTGSFTGETSNVRGTVYKDSPGQTPRGRIIIDAASIDTGIDMRNETMREEHLETQKYPEIVFDVLDILDVEQDKFRIIGNLTLHGVTHKIGIPASAIAENGKLVVRGAIDLNMTDYGIEPPVLALVIKVAEEVKISFEIILRQVNKPGSAPASAPAASPETEVVPAVVTPPQPTPSP